MPSLHGKGRQKEGRCTEVNSILARMQVPRTSKPCNALPFAGEELEIEHGLATPLALVGLQVLVEGAAACTPICAQNEV